jgi:hypothetical protein
VNISSSIDREIGRLHVLRRRPDLLEEHVVAVRVLPERLGLEVEVHRPGQRIRDDERRRGEVVHLDVGVDPALEVPVAGEDRDDGEVVLLTAAEIASLSGPELPMHGVQP